MTKNLNISLLQQKVADIKQSLVVLREYTNQEKQQFLKNAEAVRSARYAFIVLIEAATNIANHFCAKIVHEAPQSYAESFMLLANNRLIPEDLAKRLAKMTGFRNLLVHGYGRVDDQIMFNIMQQELDNLDHFLIEVANLINQG